VHRNRAIGELTDITLTTTAFWVWLMERRFGINFCLLSQGKNVMRMWKNNYISIIRATAWKDPLSSEERIKRTAVKCV
jgi:hypothetical protein